MCRRSHTRTQLHTHRRHIINVDGNWARALVYLAQEKHLSSNAKDCIIYCAMCACVRVCVSVLGVAEWNISID